MKLSRQLLMKKLLESTLNKLQRYKRRDELKLKIWLKSKKLLASKLKK